MLAAQHLLGDPVGMLILVAPQPVEFRLDTSPCLPAEQIRDLYRVAADHEIRIRRLDYRRDSLKDIFLRAMELNRGGV